MDVALIEPRDLVQAGLYGSEAEVMQAGLAALLDHHPDLRIALAVHLYARDDEWSLAGIAQWAGLTFWEMRDILLSRGVELRLGPATIEEARQEAATLERHLRGRPD
jgi:predicted HTH domain antitoxin